MIFLFRPKKSKFPKNQKKVLHLFLEGVPPEIDYNKIAFELSKIKKIQSIHHLHIWSLDGVNNAFSIHIKLDDDVNNINEIICLFYALGLVCCI